MKKYTVHIILAVVIIVLAVVIGCKYFNNQESTANSNLVATATAKPTPTVEPTAEPTEAPHEHVYTETITTEAACETDGLKNFACECGDNYTELITATGHDFGEYIYNEDATYENDGTMTATCNVCGATDTQTAFGSMLTEELTFEEMEERANAAVAEALGMTLEEYYEFIGEVEERQNSPYMSDRYGCDVGDEMVLDNGITVEYLGEDIWKDVSSNTKYKTTKELENGGLWFEPINTQQASGNPDSPYISDRYGHQVGDQMVIYEYKTVTYQGGDVWMDENSRVYTVVKDHGNGYMEFAQGLFAKPGEQPVSERVGYQPGDTIFCQSLGYSFNRVYVGNDIWYNDNEPDVELIASLQNGQLGFTRYTWK